MLRYVLTALFPEPSTPSDMAAASERVGEYHTKASQFAKRVFDFLTVMLKFQIDQVVNPKNPADKAPKGTLPRHDKMEDFLGRYCGLMLFVKETDQARYQQICSVSSGLMRLMRIPLVPSVWC